MCIFNIVKLITYIYICVFTQTEKTDATMKTMSLPVITTIHLETGCT